MFSNWSRTNRFLGTVIDTLKDLTNFPLARYRYISYGSVLRNKVYQDPDFNIREAYCTLFGDSTFSWVAASVFKVKGHFAKGRAQPSLPSPKNTLQLSRNEQVYGSFSLGGFKHYSCTSFLGSEILTVLLVGGNSSFGRQRFLEYVLVLQRGCAERR